MHLEVSNGKIQMRHTGRNQHTKPKSPIFPSVWPITQDILTYEGDRLVSVKLQRCVDLITPEGKKMVLAKYEKSIMQIIEKVGNENPRVIERQRIKSVQEAVDTINQRFDLFNK